MRPHAGGFEIRWMDGFIPSPRLQSDKIKTGTTSTVNKEIPVVLHECDGMTDAKLRSQFYGTGTYFAC